MTNKKALNEAIDCIYADGHDPELKGKDLVIWSVSAAWVKAIEHVLKVVGSFDTKAAIRAWDKDFGNGDSLLYIEGARHQHDQIIKKIKAASSGETRVLSDNVARGSKGDVG